MGLLDQVNAEVATLRRRNNPLSVDQWADYFTFGGNSYPLVQTTMSQVDRERVGTTAVSAYTGSSPVFALILARLQAFSQVRFQWTRFEGSQPGDLFGSPELAILERPKPNWTTSDLLARMEVHASVAGNAYVYRPKRDRLATMRPDRVTIVMGSETDADHPSEAPDVEVIGYLHTAGSGKVTAFTDPRLVAHYCPVPHPDAVFLGMSWLIPALREYQADALAVEHKTRFFENSGSPNLAIKFDAAIPLAEARRFKEFFESEYTGAWNAWKTVFLGGGASPIPIGLNFKDMDYAVIQGRAESRLAADAAVPPSWVGFSEGLQGSALNAGNFDSAKNRFVNGTLQHLWTNAATSLETLLDPPRDRNGQLIRGASLWFDNRVPIMREDTLRLAEIQQQQAVTIGQYVKDGWKPDSAKAAVMKNDISLLEHTGWYPVQMQPPPTGQPAAVAAAATDTSPNGKPVGVSA